MLNYLWDPAISLPGCVCNGVDRTLQITSRCYFIKLLVFVSCFLSKVHRVVFSIFLEIIVRLPFVEKLELTRLHKES